jgi:dolichol-phosphate mannosyltransferase
VRFCIAGGVGVVAYYAILYGFTEYLGVWYVASAIVAAIVNTASNFVLQKFWAFKDREMAVVGRQIVMYIIMSVLFVVGNALSLYLMVQCLHMWYIGAQMILTVVITVISFVISRRIFIGRQV